MKEPQLVQDYLRDILEAMDKAEEFVGALDLRAFSKVVHDYVGVSLEVVWRTVKEDIPLVRPALVDMLEKMEAEEDGHLH